MTIPALLTHPDILSAEVFVPESWEEILQAGVFPKEVNAHWYNSQVKAFAAMAEDTLDAWRIRYRSEDGLEITGLAILPKNAAEKKLPLVVFNRGGNREYGRLSVYNVVFPFVDLVRAGYGILASNYRGNHGGQGADEFGGRDVSDVLQLLKIGKELPWWDGARSYLLGWSRGGMMTYCAVKQGAQVNAAATLAGISDLTQLLEERPSMEWVFERFGLAGATQAAQQEALVARSAVCWPEEIHAPLLMLHGDADNKVTFLHSERLAEALTRAGQEHKLVRYDAGTHSLSRYHRDIAAELLEWFGKY
jgi:dipeptidyl aminopeptidase/acylaminoacyl peptidase